MKYLILKKKNIFVLNILVFLSTEISRKIKKVRKGTNETKIR
jgi:hypothetical protein